MDRITETMLKEFSEEYDIKRLSESARFERFATFCTIKPHHSESFDTEELATGQGGDTGIDAIAILVNGQLITDAEQLEELAAATSYLEATLIFMQSTTSPKFEVGRIGKLTYGILDFLNEKPTIIRNAKVAAFAEIKEALYAKVSKFRRGNPTCRVYYVTTGKWTADHDLEARRKAAISDIEGSGYFDVVEFSPIDARRLQNLYKQSKNAISREFTFDQHLVIPPVEGVKESYLGYLPASEYLRLIEDEYGQLIGNLFNENVRDYQGDNAVNSEIQATLDSEFKDRFVLMNNGITIIAKQKQQSANTFHIEDYQVVNGCQTSNVIHSRRASLSNAVRIPIRLIVTDDDTVINSIITATNRQTEVRAEQFFALQQFSKELETFFQSYPEEHKLFFERRTGQYDRLPVAKTRVITTANTIKAFAAMFMAEPHRTTRNYASLRQQVGKEIFVEGHRMEPYYAAAYAMWKLDFLFRNGRLATTYKSARFHILLAIGIVANKQAIPRLNSHEMERYCDSLIKQLWEATATSPNDILSRAIRAVENAAQGVWDRDNIRTEGFTKKVIDQANKVAAKLK